MSKCKDSERLSSLFFLLIFLYFVFVGRKGLLNYYDPTFSFFDSLISIFSCLLFSYCRKDYFIPYKFIFIDVSFILGLLIFSVVGYASYDFNYLGLDKAAKLCSLAFFLVTITQTNKCDWILIRKALILICFLSVPYIVLTSGGRSGFGGAGAITTARAFMNAFILYVIIGRLLSDKRVYKIDMILMVFILLAVFTSETRSVLITFSFFIVYFLHTSTNGGYRLTLYLVLFVSLYFMSPYFFESNMFYRLSVLYDENGGGSVAARFDYMREAFELAKDSDYLGVGLSNYGILAFGYPKFDYPHNIFAETLLEGGVISIILLLSFIIRSLLVMPSNMGVYIYFFIVLFNANVSGDIYDNRLLFLIPIMFFVIKNNDNLESTPMLNRKHN